MRNAFAQACGDNLWQGLRKRVYENLATCGRESASLIVKKRGSGSSLTQGTRQAGVSSVVFALRGMCADDATPQNPVGCLGTKALGCLAPVGSLRIVTRP